MGQWPPEVRVQGSEAGQGEAGLSSASSQAAAFLRPQGRWEEDERAALTWENPLLCCSGWAQDQVQVKSGGTKEEQSVHPQHQGEGIGVLGQSSWHPRASCTPAALGQGIPQGPGSHRGGRVHIFSRGRVHCTDSLGPERTGSTPSGSVSLQSALPTPSPEFFTVGSVPCPVQTGPPLCPAAQQVPLVELGKLFRAPGW